MRRREFILGLCGPLTSTVTARAETGQLARVGLLAFGQELTGRLFSVFRDEMRKLGHIEGSTYQVHFRSAHGDPGRLQTLAAELTQIPVDVIVTDGGTASIAAKKATAVIPIVMGVVSDPIELGLVQSLARPGGNVTGFSIISPQLGTKRLALLKEAVPSIVIVGVLLNSASPATGAQQLAALKNASSALGIDLVVSEARSAKEIPAVIDKFVASHVSAVMVVGDAVFFNERQLIVERAAANRLPAMYPEREYVEAGGLLAYGPSISDNFRRAAGYVARLLRGETVSNLPVEQPAKFEFVINLKAAKAIGITIPSALPLLADEVIE